MLRGTLLVCAVLAACTPLGVDDSADSEAANAATVSDSLGDRAGDSKLNGPSIPEWTSDAESIRGS